MYVLTFTALLFLIVPPSTCTKCYGVVLFASMLNVVALLYLELLNFRINSSHNGMFLMLQSLWWWMLEREDMISQICPRKGDVFQDMRFGFLVYRRFSDLGSHP